MALKASGDGEFMQVYNMVFGISPFCVRLLACTGWPAVGFCSCRFFSHACFLSYETLFLSPGMRYVV